MKIQDRAVLYNESEPGVAYPDSRFLVSDRWVSATWVMGNNYRSLSSRGDDDQPFYGSYPPGYLKRIWHMFPDVKSVIHLFSGSLTEAAAAHPGGATVTRIDVRPETHPSITADAENFMQGLPDSYQASCDLILADPPYSIEDAVHYGPCLCNKKKVLAQCHQALRPGGLLLWMDQAIPMYAKRDWRWVGVLSMYRSTNHRIRGVMMFEKQ